METVAHEAQGISHLDGPAEVELVPFEGGELPAVRSNDRGWLVLKPACDSLGVNHEAQRKRLERVPWAVASIMEATGADGRRYQMYCLRSDRVGMWLATLDASRVRNPEARRRLEAWQCHAADALDRWCRRSGDAAPSWLPPGQIFLRFTEICRGPVGGVPRPERPEMWGDARDIAAFFGFTADVFAREQVRYPALGRLAKGGRWPIFEVYELYKAITYPGLSGYAPVWAWAEVLDVVEALAERSRHGGVNAVEVVKVADSYSKLGTPLYRALRACLPKFEDHLPAAHVHELFKNYEGCVIAGKSLHRVGRSKRWAVRRSEIRSH